MSVPEISQKLSGVVINQNHTPRTNLTVTPGVTYYQTFHLPEELQRGINSKEIRYPSLSGFQYVVRPEKITEPGAVEFDWAVEQYFFGSGWTSIASGTQVGISVGAPEVWADVLFDTAITVSASMVPSELRNESPTEFRLAITPRKNFKETAYTTPNPFASGEGFKEKEQINGSFCFRILALTADSGTDFLGNPYRSIAIVSEADSAGAEPGSGYWLSAPQPSQFAVVSHYSDLRPFPTTPKYGVTNYILNPSFEYDLTPTWKASSTKWEGGLPAMWEAIGETVIKIMRYRGEWNALETYADGDGVIVIETRLDFEERQIRTRRNRESEEAVAREKWEKELSKAEITKPELEAKIKSQREAAKKSEEKEIEEREAFKENTKRYVAIHTPGSEEEVTPTPNRGMNPLETENIWWQPDVNVFEAERGIQYLEVVPGGFTRGVKLGASAHIEVTKSVPVTLSFWVRGGVGENEFKVKIKFGSAETGEASEEVTVNEEWIRKTVTLTPSETGQATIEIKGNSVHFFLDGIMVNTGTIADKYFDGDVISSLWMGIKGRSESVELIEKSSEENAVVVDSVLIDPITSGVAFNIYYSNDLTGSTTGAEPTIEDWEKKLWTHVPQTYVTSAKTTYALPEPITAKFIKLEFSNLQAKPYTPGDFQRPVVFKKFPEWVTGVFLALQSSPNFIVTNVAVTYDRLELLYNYYKADLHQSPTSPIPPKTQSGSAQDLVDPQTLAMINQISNTYTRPPAALAGNTLLGETQKANALKDNNYQVEGGASFNGKRNFPVSSLDRSNIVFQQNMPDMFFFVTCRHEYQEISGTFAENKAYYAGLKALAFIRNEYTRTSDEELYIESGGDDLNTERQDFVVEEGTWFTN